MGSLFRILADAVDVGSIVDILTTSLNVAFWAIVALLILAFLWGLLHGWRYGVYRLVSFAIWIAVFLICLEPLADFVGNFDLSGFGLPAINLAINGATVSVSWTTPFATIGTLVSEAMKALGTNLDPSELASYAISLATNSVKLVLLLVYGLLLLTLVNFVIWLFWHILFKWLTPKRIRRNRKKMNKGRIVNGLVQTAFVFVAGALVIYPLTSVVNTINQAVVRPDEETMEQIRADNGTYATVVDVLDAYDSSIFAQVFFNWSESEGMTFDAKLIDLLINSNYGDMSVSLLQELGSIASIAATALSTGVDLSGSQGEILSTLITANQTPEILRLLADNQLVSIALPFAFQIAVNIDEVSSYLLTDEGIAADSEDFSNALDSLADLYQGVLDSGTLEGLYIDDNGQMSFDLDYVFNLFNEETKADFDAFFDSIDDGKLALFENILDSFAYVQAVAADKQFGEDPNVLTIADFLPEATFVDTNNDGRPDAVSQDFKDIEWGSELRYVYDFVYEANSIDPDFAPALLSGLMASGGTGEVNMQPVIDFAVDNITDISDLFVGDLGDIDSETGHSKTEGETCLLDSSLINNAMPKMLSLLGTGINSGLFEDEEVVDMQPITDELEGATVAESMINYKRELSSLLSVMEEFLVGHPSASALLKDFEEHPGVYIDPDNVFQGMEGDIYDGAIDALRVMDSSLIASNILPAVFSKFLDGDGNFVNNLLGPEALPLDFGVENLGGELADLLAAVKELDPYIPVLTGLGSSSFSSSQIKDLLSVEIGEGSDAKPLLGYLLDLFANSKILNPVDEVDGVTVINTNYYCLMKTVADAAFGEGSFRLSIGDFQDASFAESENDAFLRVLGEIVDTGLLDNLGDVASGEITRVLRVLNAIPEEDFVSLFGSLGDSLVLKSCISDFLDENLTAALFGTDSGISFGNVTDWVEEGRSLKALIRFASEVGDLSNIDFFNSDPYAVEGIIRVCATSQLFIKDGDYLFPGFLADTLGKSLEGTSVTLIEGSYFDYGTQSFAVIEGNEYGLLKANVLSLDNPDDWVAESAVLGDVLESAQKLGGLENLSIYEMDPDLFEELMSSASYSEVLGNLLVPNVFAMVEDDLAAALVQYGGISVENANIAYVYDGTPQERAAETVLLSDLLAAVTDPTYGLMDEGQVASSVSLASLSGRHTLKPILDALADSRVFNSSYVEGTDTAFESLLASTLYGTGLYGDAVTGQEVLERVREVTDWNFENASIADALDSMKEILGGGTDLGSLDFASYFSGTAAEVEARKSDLAALLDNMDQSLLLSLAMRSQLAGMASSFEVPLVEGGLATANFAYENGEGRYGHEEIMNFVDALSILAGLGDDPLSGDMRSYVDVAKLLAQSHIFNTVKDGQERTFFQSTMYAIIGNEAISAYLCPVDDAGRPTSPKAEGFATSGDYIANFIYSVNFPSSADGVATPDNQVELDRQQGLIDSLGDVLPSISAFFGAGDFSPSSIDTETLYGLLDAINGSDLLFEMVPNILSSYLTGDNLDIEIEGIDIALANPYFSYYYDESSGVLDFDSPDWSRHYPASEIENIVDLISYLRDFRNVLGTIDFSSVSPIAFHDVLMLAHDSYVFNLAGPNQQNLSHARNAIDQLPNNLTVFEQLMLKVYDATAIGYFSFDVQEDAVFLLSLKDNNGNPFLGSYSDLLSFAAREDAKEVGSRAKLYARIIEGRDGGFDYEREIAALTIGSPTEVGFFEAIQNSDLLGSDSDLSNVSTSFENLSPDDLGLLLRSLNELELVDLPAAYLADSMVNGLPDENSSSSFSGMGMQSYSSYSVKSGSSLFGEGRILSLDISEVDETLLDGLTFTLHGKDREGTAANVSDLPHSGGHYDFGDLLPYGLEVSGLPEDSNAAFTYTVDSSDYFFREEKTIAAAAQRYREGGIETMVEMLDALYIDGDGDGTEDSYFAFDASSREGITQALDIGTATILEFLGSKGGFYVTPSGDYTGGAITLYNLLIVSSDLSGLADLLPGIEIPASANVPLGEAVVYGGIPMGEDGLPVEGAEGTATDDPLAAIGNILSLLEYNSGFADGSGHHPTYAQEGKWLDENIAGIVAFEGLYYGFEAAAIADAPSYLYLMNLLDQADSPYGDFYSSLFGSDSNLVADKPLFGANMIANLAGEMTAGFRGYAREASGLPLSTSRPYIIQKVGADPAALASLPDNLAFALEDGDFFKGADVALLCQSDGGLADLLKVMGSLVSGDPVESIIDGFAELQPDSPDAWGFAYEAAVSLLVGPLFDEMALSGYLDSSSQANIPDFMDFDSRFLTIGENGPENVFAYLSANVR